MGGLHYRLRDEEKLFDLSIDLKSKDGKDTAVIAIQGENFDMQFDPMARNELEELRDYFDLMIGKMDSEDSRYITTTTTHPFLPDIIPSVVRQRPFFTGDIQVKQEPATSKSEPGMSLDEFEGRTPKATTKSGIPLTTTNY